MSTCIFPGRFQPFHNGHLMVVQGMAKMCSNVVIAICHGDGMGEKDLFSADTVREMVSRALLEEDIVDASIIVVPDIADDGEWVQKVIDASEAEKKDVQVWSGREEVLKLFEAAGVQTKKIAHVPGIESDAIRELIAARDDKWRSFMPGASVDAVMDYLDVSKG